MKILAIGDPHGDIDKLKKIPFKGVDLILCTGDVGKAALARKRAFENAERKKKGLPELEFDKSYEKASYAEVHDSSIEVLKFLSGIAPTYSILGNVGMDMIYDSNVRRDEKKFGIKLPSLRGNMNKIKDFHFVRNVLRNVDGLRIGFLEYFTDTSWVKEFKPGDYDKRMKKARRETDKTRNVLERFGNLDILVCHQPPYGYLDKVTGKYGAPKFYQGKHAGSKAILDYVKKYQPKYVFCGHIHEGEGKTKIGKTEVYNLGVAGYKIIDLPD